MKLVALDLPENDAELAGWIERQLLSTDLADLVAQLSVFRPSDRPESLSGILGDRTVSVLDSGLSFLPQEVLRALLQNPMALLDLQTKVLLEGGPYWTAVPDVPPPNPLSINPQSADSRRSSWPTGAPPTNSRRKGLWIATLGLAASIAVVAATVWRPPPTPKGWGFQQTDLLVQKLSADAYLRSLSDAANQWFEKPPQSKEALQQRLLTFRAGCDALLAAQHPQLAPPDRLWLLGRCQVWRSSIDARLREVESGRLAVNEIRKRSDTLIRQIIDELSRRAQAV